MTKIDAEKESLFTFHMFLTVVNLKLILYSDVMQSDGNSFCEDVVLDSFNMVYSDEDSI